MSKPIILFSSIENLSNNVFNIILWTVNLFCFCTGSYIIANHYENLNTPNGIQDCSNVMLMICLTVLNSLLIMIGFFKYLFVSIFTFCSSLLLFIYQLVNYQAISKECRTYYTLHYKNVWGFNEMCIIVLGFNVLMYFVKYLNFRSLDTKNSETNENNENNEYTGNNKKYITINTEDEEAPLITRQSNYENDPRLFHDHIYESN